MSVYEHIFTRRHRHIPSRVDTSACCFARSRLIFSPLRSSSLLSSPCTSDAVADVTGGYTYLRRARVQGEWHVHDASLGALHRTTITRGVMRSRRIKHM